MKETKTKCPDCKAPLIILLSPGELAILKSKRDTEGVVVTCSNCGMKFEILNLEV